jgi:hypothetical protein
LPGGPDTGDLEDKNAVVGKEIVHLAEENAIATDTDVLQGGSSSSPCWEKNETDFGHFKGNDLGVVTGTTWDLTVIHTENASLVVANAIFLDPVISKLGLVLAKCDSGDVTAVILCSKRGECAPAAEIKVSYVSECYRNDVLPAADVEETVRGLKVQFGADDGEFVFLELFEGGGSIDSGDDS